MEASLIIPTYNRVALLKKTLQSLSRLASPVDTFEVIVVDDGSDDETGDFVQSASFPFDLRFFRHQDNRFASAARNTGIRAAQGEVILFLDDDMEVVPEFLEEHLNYHRGPRQAAVMGNIRMHPGIIPTGMIRYLSSRGVHKLKPGQGMPFRYWCSGNASLKRSIVLEAGLFDERIRCYGGEDLELAYRLQQRGDLSFHFASKAVSYHMHYRDFDEVCRLMFQYGRTSLAYLIEKHPELATTVRANLMDPIRWERDRLPLIVQKIFMRAALHPAIYALFRWYGECVHSGSPAFVYDYVIAFNYLRGLQEAKKTGKRINRE
jgi:glycosyltransferase involved in cell wall biosynthesis